MNILITGGCGFIGHHIVEHILRKINWNIIIIDKLNYASFGLDRLEDIGLKNNPRIKIITWDLIIPFTLGVIKEIESYGDIHYILHLAAETHVDNSISDPVNVINNNILSTVQILEYTRRLKNFKMSFYFSTDEVFGNALGTHSFKECDAHHPTNPYSASKSASEMICISYENTYKIPLIIVNDMNAFGERQHVEKFIPKIIKYLLDDKEIEIHTYADCLTPGSRFYIHARNIAAAILFLIENGKIGEKYNISGEKEIDNLEMAKIIAEFMNKPLKYKLIDFHTNRPGHDTRYALNDEKIKNMGFTIPVPFEQSLKNTIDWTLKNQKWLNQM